MAVACPRCGAILQVKARRHFYVANELETIEDVGVSSLCEAPLEHPPRGFDVAVVKRGDSGVTVVEVAEGVVRRAIIPAFPVRTSSTIGSGDVFAGAFAACLAYGESAVMAAKWGCAAAAISLQANKNLLTSEAYERARELISG